ADGATIVAIGADGAPLVSVDAGKTWTVHALGGDLTATAITATPNGFVATASTSHRNAAVLTSGDGVTWRRLRVPGLSGDGERRLTALPAAGSSVLAARVAADGQGEAALLWKAPHPSVRDLADGRGTSAVAAAGAALRARASAAMSPPAVLLHQGRNVTPPCRGRPWPRTRGGSVAGDTGRPRGGVAGGPWPAGGPRGRGGGPPPGGA